MPRLYSGSIDEQPSGDDQGDNTHGRTYGGPYKALEANVVIQDVRCDCNPS